MSAFDIIWAGIVMGAGLVVYATFIEPLMLRLKRLDVRIPDLPPSLDGFTICHMSDLHAVRFGRLETKLERILAKIDADLCVITGDIGYVPVAIEVLRRLCASFRPKLGTFAVAGNGDYKVGVPSEIARDCAEFGIRFLFNESVLISEGGRSLHVIGVDDPHRGLDDLARAERGVTGEGFKLLLAHSPDVLVDVTNDSADLILVGHTHGGQVRLPFLGAFWLHCRHDLGISRGYYPPNALSAKLGRDLSRVHLYVNTGIGGSWVKTRFMCPPEVALITLRSAECEVRSAEYGP